MTTLQELNGYARNVIDFFHENKIDSREGLEAIVVGSCNYDRKKYPHIEVKKRGTNAVKLSYSVKDKGIPLEIIIDKNNGAMIIIKIETTVKGYISSGKDHYNNISQRRTVRYENFNEVIDEIRFLAYHTTNVKIDI